MYTYKIRAIKVQHDRLQKRSFFNYLKRKLSGAISQILVKQKSRANCKTPLMGASSINSIKVPFRKNL